MTVRKEIARRHEIKEFYSRWAEPSHAADGLTFLERYYELLDGGFRGICVLSR
jgi:hypothetical protein